MTGKREFGDYQTPLEFADQVCAFLKNRCDINPSVIVEPTCGIGAFLKASLIFDVKKIYGIEINPEYCQICSDEIEDCRVRIINSDFFNCDIKNLVKGENALVVGNPPWVTNSTLSAMNSTNLPQKVNFKGLKGIEALIGSSNFDICEYIILKLLSIFRDSKTTIAMLCKTSVARNVFQELHREGISCDYCELYEFEASKIFGISASACLFLIQLTDKEGMVPKACNIYDFEEPKKIKGSFGYQNGFFYSDLSSEVLNFDGLCCFEWRQGVKHDCSKIMELTKQNNKLINGKKEIVDIESDIVFPLVKSSMFKKAVINTFSKYVIVTQRKVKEETGHLEHELPKTWAYLMANKDVFNSRKSSIYCGAPPFSMFGVGDYSYSKYKVGVSGFYKNPLFSILFSDSGTPVMTDDTSYFICFDKYEDAYVAMLYLNSDRVITFLKSIAFLDAKRPYTKKVLSRINFRKVVEEVSMGELLETEDRLELQKYLTKEMVENFSKLISGSSLFDSI